MSKNNRVKQKTEVEENFEEPGSQNHLSDYDKYLFL
jgi:hypothetical protein